jgi:hypothetical protein
MKRMAALSPLATKILLGRRPSLRRLMARRVRSAAGGQLWTRSQKLGIHVRTGVHTGECEVIGENLGGIAVSQCILEPGLGPSLLPTKYWYQGQAVTLSRGRARDLGSGKGVPGSWQLLAAA